METREKRREKEVDRIFARGIVKEVIPSRDDLRKRLVAEEPMRFYIGADPTSTALHLSHAKNYMLLEEIRMLGHEVIVLFGDFTAKIGDPTDRGTARRQLSEDDVKANVAKWMEQIRPLMDFDAVENPPRVVFNSKWLAPLTFADVIDLASNFSVQRMLERDMFEKRMQDEKPVFVHEFMYPLMQGFDSVALEVDVELCGTDQIFNALVGRTLLKRMKGKEKIVVAVNLMENPKTGELMSKSRGNGVFLDSTPFDMFGSIMAQPDEMIEVLLVNNTRLPLEEIERLKGFENPMDAKLVAAFEITKIFHGEGQAESARERFATQVRRRETPDDAPVISMGSSDPGLLGVVIKCNPGESNSSNRRLILQGGVRVDGHQEKNPREVISVHTEGVIVRVGKKKIFKVVP